jgi:hypothetical protein
MTGWQAPQMGPEMRPGSDIHRLTPKHEKRSPWGRLQAAGKLTQYDCGSKGNVPSLAESAQLV